MRGTGVKHGPWDHQAELWGWAETRPGCQHVGGDQDQMVPWLAGPGCNVAGAVARGGNREQSLSLKAAPLGRRNRPSLRPPLALSSQQLLPAGQMLRPEPSRQRPRRRRHAQDPDRIYTVEGNAFHLLQPNQRQVSSIFTRLC